MNDTESLFRAWLYTLIAEDHVFHLDDDPHDRLAPLPKDVADRLERERDEFFTALGYDRAWQIAGDILMPPNA